MAGLLALWAWVAFGNVPRFALGGALLVWLGCSGVAAHFWQQSPTGTIDWDGWVWRFDPSVHFAHSPSAYVGVHLDLQHSLWVCLHPKKGEKGPVLWLWLEQRHAPLLWADLRRAVYSRARPESTNPPDETHERSFSG